MATFAAVNTTPATAPDAATPTPAAAAAAKPGDERTPTTPKAAFAPRPAVSSSSTDGSAPSTPTTRDAAGHLPGQRPLPDEPLTPVTPTRTPGRSRAEPDGSLKRAGSQRSTKSPEPDDVEMGDDGPDGSHDESHTGSAAAAADDDGSDKDSVTSDSHRPSKKKKGQRFFCTEFPPCQLSFTRSEHLARHIRKHTGERPFQCHCSRRFSRLDNLRQHAQTVHVNEEIPGDSLAATSTRFQRQIRTDRVRPPGSRPRASTLGSSQGGHSRGHSRNLSASSVGSTASSIGGNGAGAGGGSGGAGGGVPDDARRRPLPLARANDPAARARPTIDTYNAITASPGQQYAYYFPQSPSGYSTPTSQTSFAGGPASPRLSGMTSPTSALSRSSFYNGSRHGPPVRRLSVPSAPHPFHHQQQQPQQQHHPVPPPPPLNAPGSTGSYPPAYFSPIPSGTSSTFSPSGSIFGSPSSSIFSPGRRDSETELEDRRRTWHPGTYPSYSQRPATSGLSYHQTPDDQRPAPSSQPAASQVTRLPGIESFDHAPPSTARAPPPPPPRQPSPMMVDSRPASSHRGSDAGLHQGITRLDIAAANAPAEGQWQAVPPPAGAGAAAPPSYAPQQQQQQQQQQRHFIHHQHSSSMPEPITPRKNKRQGWYGGPVQAHQHQPPPSQPPPSQPAYTLPSAMSHRPSPEDSGSSDGVPTPSTSHGTEYHPVIVNPNGIPEGYAPVSSIAEEQQQQQPPPKVGVLPPPSLPPPPARADWTWQQTYAPPPPPPTSPPQTYALQAGHDPRYPPTTYSQPPNNDMGRLEALVAVATSENRAVEHRS